MGNWWEDGKNKTQQLFLIFQKGVCVPVASTPPRNNKSEKWSFSWYTILQTRKMYFIPLSFVGGANPRIDL
jgi:hypothetical protein